MTKIERLHQFDRRLWVGMVCAVLLLSSCSSAPHSPPHPDAGYDPDVEFYRQDIVQYAKSFLGTPYRTGGSTRKGMDCSGLVMTVYQEFKIDLPRTSLDQSRVGTAISRSEIAPGDLVFFKTSNQPVSHVGIYIGKGKFIHASTSAKQVRIDALDNTYFRPRFVTAKCVIGG